MLVSSTTGVYFTIRNVLKAASPNYLPSFVVPITQEKVLMVLYAQPHSFR